MSYKKQEIFQLPEFNREMTYTKTFLKKELFEKAIKDGQKQTELYDRGTTEYGNVSNMKNIKNSHHGMSRQNSASKYLILLNRTDLEL